jgi:hypothetical protein
LRTSQLLALILLLSQCGAASGQASLVKTLTPEQQVYQKKLADYTTERNNLRGVAVQVYDAEMARAKAGDCPHAATTYDFNACYGKAKDDADHDLKTYEFAVRKLLGMESPQMQGQTPPATGEAPQQQVAEFDRLEQQWRLYSDLVSPVAFAQSGGGSGGPSFELETHVRLVRDHLEELHTIYGLMLSK